MRTSVVVSLFALALTGCSRTPSQPFSQFVDGVVYEYLALSPSGASQNGYHEHKGQKLDELLDDFSANNIASQKKFYLGVQDRLRHYKPEELNAEARIDHRILSDLAAYNLLEIDTIQSYRHNPTVYVELLGNALNTPHTVEYAPPSDRYRAIVARLRRIPAFLDTARANLVDSPAIWNQVAQEENAGTIDLIDKTIRASVPVELRSDFEAAAPPAIDALRKFNAWLKDSLSQKTSDWRLGKANYDRKFALVMQSGATPEQVLQQAEASLREVRRQMFDIALPLHHKMYPTHRDPVNLNLIVGETLAKIAERHTTADQFLATARKDLEETRAFVQSHNLVPPTSHDNLQVIETPEFMRGAYGVGGFNPAPVLQPEMGAFYWVTPIPANWTKDRVESKLREYNAYALKLLTIHEAMPGHYVQFEYANALQPKARRVLRAVAGNGAYVEGWAVYATEMMLDEGYLDKSPELRLTFLKQQLRMIANAILDIRLQTLGMTDEQALKLMIEDTFQEKEEATAKLQRAKLTSTQLPTYFVGYYGWHTVRDAYKKATGTGFVLSEFHQKALRVGAVPLDELGRMLTAR